MGILKSIAGIIVLFAIAIALSNNRKAISKRLVIGAFLFQLGFAFIALYTALGKTILLFLSDIVTNILAYTKEGTQFVFGGLSSPKMYDLFGAEGFVVALEVLPVIVFFSALSTLLFHLGIMQWFVKIIGGSLQKILGTSKAESMSASANIFLGVTEAPLVIKPYLGKLSPSEFFAVLVGGVASIAGSMLLAYANFGVKIEYLLAASFMSAPAGLMFAKILFPENRSVEELDNTITVALDDDQQTANVIDAITKGASLGLTLALNIGAMLLVIIALVALTNGLLGWVGQFFGWTLSLDLFLGWILSPVAYIMGVDWSEAAFAGSLLGQKIVFTEILSYTNLMPYLDGQILETTGNQLSGKTQIILSFALCSFANVATLAIAVPGIGGMCPERRVELTRIAVRALYAALLANFLNGTIAGLMYELGNMG
ncbi:MAG: nucleoside transporter C-terminal domain-containing protein [Bacteroidota bacterium]